MQAAIIPDVEQELHEARSLAYASFASAFRYPAGLDPLAWLRDRGMRSAWPDCLNDLAPDLDRAWRAFEQAASAAAADTSLEDTYVRLFGHAVRGTCPPYELEYGSSEVIQLSSEMADIAGFYSAFGLELADDAGERQDHVSVQLEFMAVLAAKHAHAHVQRDDAALDIVRDAERKFLRSHLARWFPSFAHRVRQADPGGYYVALVDAAESLILADARRLGVPTNPPLIEPEAFSPPDDSQITCGLDAGPPGVTDEPVPLGIDDALVRRVRENDRANGV